MRVLVFGNSGSGKSTYAAHLARHHHLAHLDLDVIVWEPHAIAVRRPEAAVLADLRRFIDNHREWVIEGCYGELVTAAAKRSSELVFLNPGSEACLRNCKARPWEPAKYRSKEEQDRMLPFLLHWVREYYTRDDEWSLLAHRRVYDAYAGPKRELTSLVDLQHPPE